MSFIMSGGQIEAYDVFMETAELDGYNEGADIYNNMPEYPIIANSDSMRYSLTLPLNSGVLSRTIMRPSSTVPRTSYSQIASG